MTKGEAASILNIKVDARLEELEDQFEQLLFESKTYFLKKVPIQKLFRSKLTSIQQLIKAYELLSESKIETSQQHLFFDFIFDSSDVLISFNNYHLYRNQLKQALINTFNFEKIDQLVTELLKLESAYAFFWYKENIDTQNTLVASLPDDIQLLNAIKQYVELGGKSFDDLKNLKNNPPEILIQEMKRLSLLYKNYRWTKS
jgi:hypothetical protein